MGKKKMLMRKFGSIAIVNNTFIGGVASVINTPALLAAKLSITENDIQNFSIVGSDIECCIEINYNITLTSFDSNLLLTYYIDKDKYCKKIGGIAFRNCVNLTYIELEGVTHIDGGAFRNTRFKEAIFPNLLELTNINAGTLHFYSCTNLDLFYAPLCLKYGLTTSYNAIFELNKQGLRVYVHPTMETINSGGVEGDLAYVTSTLNGTVTYVTNFDKPSQITDLAVNTVYATAIKLDWSVPTSTNAIDYYEVYVDGVFYKNSSTNEITIFGLTNLQTYTFSVIAVDIFYNKSEISNIVTQQINGVGREWLDNLTSYYKFENNVLDSIGNNDGIATDITYVSGQVGNAAVFNGSGSNSLINLGDSDDLSFTNGSDLPFSISTIVKLNTNNTGIIVTKQTLNIREWNIFYDAASGQLNARVFSNGSNSTYKQNVINVNLGLVYNSIIWTFDGNLHKIYVNGVLINGTSTTVGSYVGMVNTNVPVSIGAMTDYNPATIDADIDDTSIFNKELSQAEATEIYNIHNAGFPLI